MNVTITDIGSMIEARGNGVDMNAIKDAVTKVDLKKLEGMKNAGVQ